VGQKKIPYLVESETLLAHTKTALLTYPLFFAAANQWINEATRLQWKKEGSDQLTPGKWPTAPVNVKAVTLTPKQIRTFVITVAPKK